MRPYRNGVVSRSQVPQVERQLVPRGLGTILVAGRVALGASTRVEVGDKLYGAVRCALLPSGKVEHVVRLWSEVAHDSCNKIETLSVIRVFIHKLFKIPQVHSSLQTAPPESTAPWFPKEWFDHDTQTKTF